MKQLVICYGCEALSKPLASAYTLPISIQPHKPHKINYINHLINLYKLLMHFTSFSWLGTQEPFTKLCVHFINFLYIVT